MAVPVGFELAGEASERGSSCLKPIFSVVIDNYDMFESGSETLNCGGFVGANQFRATEDTYCPISKGSPGPRRTRVNPGVLHA